MGRATKDKRDLYYRRAKEEGWRARSAYKLIQIDETFGIFEGTREFFFRGGGRLPFFFLSCLLDLDLLTSKMETKKTFLGVRNAVDLCAAPGSWSQVLSRRLYLPALAAREAARAERRGESKREGNDKDDNHGEDGDDGEEALLPALPRIVAVDLQPMAPVEGVFQIQGDITSAATAAAVISAMSRGAGAGGGGGGGGGQGNGESGDSGEGHDGGGEPRPKPPSHSPSPRAQLVVCDGAPDVTGLHDMDEFMQSQLVVAALTVSAELLEEGGTLVAKVFRGREAPALLAQLEPFFRGEPLASRSASAAPSPSRSSSSSPSYGGGVFLAKPRASRNASVEAFVVCRGYRAPEGLVPRLLGGEGLWPALAGAAGVGASLLPSSRDASSPAAKLVPFVACGDLRGWDADRSYDLPAAPAGAGRRRRGSGGRKKGKEEDGDGGGEDEEGEEGEEAEAFYVPLPPTALPTAPAYAGALALSGRPAAGMKGAGA
jgi:tRNA (cytidine32/guanosine34-2'-O)-methyltransferase